MAPIRISIIGIDGSGKSTTTLRAIHSLNHGFSICKTGRTPFFIWKGNVSYCLPKAANFFEGLFKKVDATKKRQWIGMTRLLFVFFQGWLEPYMIKKYHPDLVMTARCMVIDSAIYSEFYYPFISQRMTIEGKLKLTRKYSRLPFRDLYFFLAKPIDWDRFFFIMAISFSLVWAIYSIILLGYVFLVEGKHRRNKSKTRKEEDPFPPKLIQEWEALWKITIKRYKDPRMGNHEWN